MRVARAAPHLRTVSSAAYSACLIVAQWEVLAACNYEELLEMSGRECPVFGCGETLRRRSIAIDAELRAQLLEVPASISSV